MLNQVQVAESILQHPACPQQRFTLNQKQFTALIHELLLIARRTVPTAPAYLGTGVLSAARPFLDTIATYPDEVHVWGVPDVVLPHQAHQIIHKLNFRSPLHGEHFFMVAAPSWWIVLAAKEYAQQAYNCVLTTSPDAVKAVSEVLSDVPYLPESDFSIQHELTAHLLWYMATTLPDVQQIARQLGTLSVPLGFAWMFHSEQSNRWDNAMNAFDRITNAQQVALYRLDPDNQVLVPLTAKQAAQRIGLFEDKPLTRAALASQIIQVEDDQGHNQLILPIVDTGQLWGVVEVQTAQPMADDRLEQLSLMAEIIGMAVAYDTDDLYTQVALPTNKVDLLLEQASADSVPQEADAFPQDYAAQSYTIEAEGQFTEQDDLDWPELDDFQQAFFDDKDNKDGTGGNAQAAMLENPWGLGSGDDYGFTADPFSDAGLVADDFNLADDNNASLSAVSNNESQETQADDFNFDEFDLDQFEAAAQDTISQVSEANADNEFGLALAEWGTFDQEDLHSERSIDVFSALNTLPAVTTSEFDVRSQTYHLDTLENEFNLDMFSDALADLAPAAHEVAETNLNEGYQELIAQYEAAQQRIVELEAQMAQQNELKRQVEVLRSERDHLSTVCNVAEQKIKALEVQVNSVERTQASGATSTGLLEGLSQFITRVKDRIGQARRSPEVLEQVSNEAQVAQDILEQVTRHTATSPEDLRYAPLTDVISHATNGLLPQAAQRGITIQDMASSRDLTIQVPSRPVMLAVYNILHSVVSMAQPTTTVTISLVSNPYDVQIVMQTQLEARWQPHLSGFLDYFHNGVPRSSGLAFAKSIIQHWDGTVGHRLNNGLTELIITLPIEA